MIFYAYMNSSHKIGRLDKILRFPKMTRLKYDYSGSNVINVITVVSNVVPWSSSWNWNTLSHDDVTEKNEPFPRPLHPKLRDNGFAGQRDKPMRSRETTCLWNWFRNSLGGRRLRKEGERDFGRAKNVKGARGEGGKPVFPCLVTTRAREPKFLSPSLLNAYHAG